MAKKSNKASHLADKIVNEVSLLIPTQMERKAIQTILKKKIEGHLLGAGYHDEAAETRRVTILLSDIRGFTALAETYSAMTVVELLNRYFSVMSEIIVQYGGTIDKLMGDSIMVLFGAPDTHADDVERAIACSVAMQQAMSDFNEQNKALGLPELYIGIGINTGTVVAGPVGSKHHREYTVIGDEVNLVSRIEAQSLRGQILISENTYQLAKNYILVGEPNQVRVKGKRLPVALFELMGTTKPRSMTVPRREIRKSPRIDVQMPCFFYCLSNKAVLPQRYQGEVIDIAYNGLLFISPIELESFSEIKIEISLQLFGTDTSDIYARIIKSEQVERGYQCSLEFTSIDLAGQQTIKQFVDNLVFQA